MNNFEILDTITHFQWFTGAFVAYKMTIFQIRKSRWSQITFHYQGWHPIVTPWNKWKSSVISKIISCSHHRLWFYYDFYILIPKLTLHCLVITFGLVACCPHKIDPFYFSHLWVAFELAVCSPHKREQFTFSHRWVAFGLVALTSYKSDHVVSGGNSLTIIVNKIKTRSQQLLYWKHGSRPIQQQHGILE